MLEDSKTGFGKLKVAGFALQMGIIFKDEFKQIEKKAILSYLDTPVSTGSRDAICSYYSQEKMLIERKDLKDNLFSDSNGLFALSCLKSDDKQIAISILKTAQSHKNPEIRKSAIWALQVGKSDDKSIINFLEDKMLNAQSNDEKALSFLTLSTLGYESNGMYAKLEQMLKSNKIVSALGSSAPEYVLGFSALSSIKLKNYEQFKHIYSTWKALKRKDEHETESFGSALTNLSIEEQAIFYNDTTIANPAFRREMRKSLYQTYWKDDSKATDHKMPLEAFPFYLEDLKEDTNNQIGQGLFERVRLSSIGDEEKFVQIIKNAKWSKEKQREILRPNYFPIKTYGNAIISYMVELYDLDNNFYANEIAMYLQKKAELTNVEKEALKPLLKTQNGWLKQTLEGKKVILTGSPFSRQFQALEAT